MKFKSPTGKDIQINLDNGHSGTVFADRFEDLHPMFHREALMAGAITDNMDLKAIESATEEGGTAMVRKDRIRDAIIELLDGGDQENFTQSGQPKLAKVRELVGFGIDREEMMAVWAEITADEGGNDE